MEEDYGFCTRCGATHQPGAEFCPQCGKSFVNEPDTVSNHQSSNSLMFFTVLLGIFAAISLGEGIYSTVFNDDMISYVESTHPNDLAEYLSGLGLETIEQLADLIYIQGLLILIDGVVVLLAFFLCIRRRYWRAVFVLCLVASSLVLASFVFMMPEMMEKELFSVIVQTVIGLLMARGVYMNRGAFR